MFKEEKGEGQNTLGRVLKAYSNYNTKLGYCQGMGFIAALFLMMMEEVCLESWLVDSVEKERKQNNINGNRLSRPMLSQP